LRGLYFVQKNKMEDTYLLTINIFITTLASILLLDQWLQNQKIDRNDKALLWLSLSFIVWIPAILSYEWFKQNKFLSNEVVFVSQMLSLANNVFILLAYPHFQHSRGDVSLFKGRFKIALEGAAWSTTIAILTAITLALTAGFLTFFPATKETPVVFMAIPNTLFSLFSVLMLWWAMDRTFRFRKRWLLQYITALTFLVFLAYQIYFVIPYLEWLKVSSYAISTIPLMIKISYVLLIYQLANSWTEEQKGLFDQEKLYIEILGPENLDNAKKMDYIFIMSLDKNFVNGEVVLSYVETITLLTLTNARYLSRDNGYVKVAHMDQHRLLFAIALNMLARSKNKGVADIRRETSHRKDNNDFNPVLREEALELSARLNSLLLSKKYGKRRLKIRRGTNLVYSNKELYYSLKRMSDEVRGEKARLNDLLILADLKTILDISSDQRAQNDEGLQHAESHS